MREHTPGPWTRDKDTGGLPEVWGRARETLVAVVQQECGRDEALANARLIAAAPDLLTSLLAIVNDWSSSEDHDVPLAAIEAARTAIAKALAT